MLGRRMLFTAGVNLAQQAIALVAGVIVARLLGPEPIGAISAAMAMLSMFKFLGDLGFGSAHIKHLSEGCDVGRCMGIFIPLDVGLSLLAVAVGLAIYAIRSVSSVIPTQIPPTIMLVVALGYLATQLCAIPRATFLGFQNVVKRDTPRIVSQGLGSVLRIGAAVAGAGAIGLAVADTLSAFLLLAIYVWLLWGIPISKPDVAILKSYFSFSTVVLLAGVLYSLIQPLDRVLLEVYCDLTSVGLYSTALRLTNPLRMTVNMSSSLFFPHLAQLQARGDLSILQAFLTRAERRLALATVPLGIGSVAIAEPLVALLLGPVFAPVSHIFPLLVFQAALSVLGYLYWKVTIATGKKGGYLLSTALASGLQALLLLCFLQDWYGVTTLIGGPLVGTATALVISSLLQMAVYRWFAARTVGVVPSWRVSIHLVSGAVCSVLAAWLIRLLGWKQILGTGLVGSGAVLLHCVILWIVGELSRDEIGFFLDTLNPARVKAFVMRGMAKENGHGD